ncbi:MAG: tetratricopeptide repeat protein [Chitinivibrionales bacterium]|nr:tetratricopeptide repeat protein [Chitinivibrionales bacterium]MBD3394898.1 tetratricopeptide repeat protein [Chitinivibrionales bacterium]
MVLTAKSCLISVLPTGMSFPTRFPSMRKAKARVRMRPGRVLLSAILAASCAATALEIEFDFNDTAGMGALPSVLVKVADEAYKANLKGLKALDESRYDEAIEYFEQAQHKLPGYSDAANNHGVAYFRKGNTARARDIWEGLARADRRYPTAHYNLGLLSYHEGSPDDALDHLEQALKANRRFVHAFVLMGRIKLERGQVRHAVADLRKASDINPGERSAWSMYAYALIESGDTVEAREVLEKHRADPYALSMLGKLAAARGDFQRARNYLAGAVARGGDIAGLLDLAAIQSDSGSCRDVLKTLGEYFDRARPPAADAFLLAGIAAKECDNVPVARAYFERGLQAYPADAIMRFNLGQIYFYQGEYDRARATWASLADTLQDPTLHHLQAVIAHRKGQLDAARRHIRDAIALDPKAEYHDFLGVILHAQGKKNEAVASFKKALALNPSLQSAQLHLAVAVKSKQELRASLAAKRAQLDTCSSGCADIRLQLAILHYHNGDITNAAKALESVPADQRSEKVYRHLAFFYKSMHAWDRAIQALETARQTFVVEAQTEYELVECYMQAGLYAEAAGLLKQLVGKWADKAWRLYYQIGYACMEQNRLAEAEKYLQRSLNMKKGYVPAQGLLAYVYNRQGRQDEARRIWSRTLEADPDNHVLWINMGLALEKEGRYAEALEKYRTAASLDKDDKSIQVNIGNALAGMERHREALAAFRTALGSPKRESAAYNAFVAARKLDDRKTAGSMIGILNDEYPSSANRTRAQADMHLWDGDTAAALRLLEGLDAPDEADWFAMAGIHAARGEKDKLDSAIARLPSDPVWQKAARELQAKVAFARGEYENARVLWGRTNDTSFATQYNIALCFLHEKRYEEALEGAKKLRATTGGKNLADALRIGAGAAFALKKWDIAFEWYRALYRIDQNDPVTLFNLGVASHQLGKDELAWRYYQHAVRLDPSRRDQEFEKRAGSRPATVPAASELDTLDYWYNQAVDLQTEGDDTAAEQLYLRITGRDENYFRAWNNLGAIYSARGDLENAEQCYERALNRKDPLVETYANLINIAIARSDMRRARQWLREGRRRHPDSGLLDEMEDTLVEAIARQKRVAENPDNPD